MREFRASAGTEQTAGGILRTRQEVGGSDYRRRMKEEEEEVEEGEAEALSQCGAGPTSNRSQSESELNKVVHPRKPAELCLFLFHFIKRTTFKTVWPLGVVVSPQNTLRRCTSSPAATVHDFTGASLTFWIPTKVKNLLCQKLDKTEEPDLDKIR